MKFVLLMVLIIYVNFIRVYSSIDWEDYKKYRTSLAYLRSKRERRRRAAQDIYKMSELPDFVNVTEGPSVINTFKFTKVVTTSENPVREIRELVAKLAEEVKKLDRNINLKRRKCVHNRTVRPKVASTDKANTLKLQKRRQCKRKHKRRRKKKQQSENTPAQNERKLRWGKWTKWTSCSVSCGRGRQIRWRHCLSKLCNGAETEMEEKACQLPACLIKLFGIF